MYVRNQTAPTKLIQLSGIRSSMERETAPLFASTRITRSNTCNFLRHIKKLFLEGFVLKSFVRGILSRDMSRKKASGIRHQMYPKNPKGIATLNFKV